MNPLEPKHIWIYLLENGVQFQTSIYLLLVALHHHWQKWFFLININYCNVYLIFIRYFDRNEVVVEWYKGKQKKCYLLNRNLNDCRPTLNETKSWTRHVKIASLPTGTVIFEIGALKLGSAVNKEIYIFINIETYIALC